VWALNPCPPLFLTAWRNLSLCPQTPALVALGLRTIEAGSLSIAVFPSHTHGVGWRLASGPHQNAGGERQQRGQLNCWCPCQKVWDSYDDPSWRQCSRLLQTGRVPASSGMVGGGIQRAMQEHAATEAAAAPGQRECPKQLKHGALSWGSCWVNVYQHCFLLIKLSPFWSPVGRQGCPAGWRVCFPRCWVGLKPREVKYNPPQGWDSPQCSPALCDRGLRHQGYTWISAHLALIQHFKHKIPHRKIKPGHNDSDWKLPLSSRKHDRHS
jgi:hypothetical protein